MLPPTAIAASVPMPSMLPTCGLAQYPPRKRARGKLSMRTPTPRIGLTDDPITAVDRVLDADDDPAFTAIRPGERGSLRLPIDAKFFLRTPPSAKPFCSGPATRDSAARSSEISRTIQHSLAQNRIRKHSSKRISSAVFSLPCKGSAPHVRNPLPRKRCDRLAEGHYRDTHLTDLF